jgi:hypothetical protein
MPQLLIQQVLPHTEIIHYADKETLISSFYNKISWKKGDKTTTIRLPYDGWKSPFGLLRLSRRALRLDKCNIFLTADQNLVIIRQGLVFFYDAKTEQLTQTLILRNCRNILHQSISQTPDGYIYFGEYGHNAHRGEVPVYRSSDGGRSWEIIFMFGQGDIKHVHGCYYDAIEDKIWVCTGDFANENWLLVADRDFKNIERIGNGQQQYRSCNLFFEEDHVHWLMDSQLEPSYHIKLNRKNRQIEQKQLFAGPIWYIKRLTDGYFLAGTTQEIGAGVLDKYAHLMISKDLETWTTLHKFEHDGLPMRYFKFGVLGFADGQQSSRKFYLFIEALKKYDGKTLVCSIKD